MATTYTLTGKAADLVGEGFAASDLTGYVEASQEVVNEADVNRQRYGRSPLSFASDGTWSVDLVGTGDLVQAYRVVIRIRDRILGVKTVESEWFEITADTEFGEVVAIEVQEVQVAGAAAAAAAASAASATSAATAAATDAATAAAAAAQAVDVSNIAVPDDLVTALVEDDTSDTRAALSVTFLPQPEGDGTDGQVLALDGGQVVWADPEGGGGGGGGDAFTKDNARDLASYGNMAKARGLALTASQTSLVTLVTMGTSLTAGTGSTNLWTKPWPARLKALLVAAGAGDGGSGFVPGHGGTVNPAGDNATFVDLRWVQSGSAWTGFSGSGSVIMQCSTPDAPITATAPTGAQDTAVDIWYFNGGGSFTYAIDGGSEVTVTPNSGQTTSKVTVSGLSAGQHSVTLKNVTGTTFIAGATFRKATGLVVVNLGIGGSSTNNFSDASTGASPFATLRGVAPQIVMAEYGANEGAVPVPSTFVSNLQSGITAAAGIGAEVALIGDPPRAGAPAYIPAQREVLYGLADLNRLGMVDTLRGFDGSTYEEQTALGNTANDNVHYSDGGNLVWAELIGEMFGVGI